MFDIGDIIILVLLILVGLYFTFGAKRIRNQALDEIRKGDPTWSEAVNSSWFVPMYRLAGVLMLCGVVMMLVFEIWPSKG